METGFGQSKSPTVFPPQFRSTSVLYLSWDIATERSPGLLFCQLDTYYRMCTDPLACAARSDARSKAPYRALWRLLGSFGRLLGHFGRLIGRFGRSKERLRHVPT